MRRVTLPLLIGCAMCLIAADSPDLPLSVEDWQAYREREQEATEARINELREWIRGVPERIRDIQSDGSLSRDERREELEELAIETRRRESLLDDLIAGESYVYPHFDIGEPEAGNLGYPKYEYLPYSQHEQPDDEIVRHRATPTIIDIVDGSTIVVEYSYMYQDANHNFREGHHGPLWISGVDTSEMVTGQDWEGEDETPLIYSGPTSFGGARIHSYERADIEQIRDVMGSAQ